MDPRTRKRYKLPIWIAAWLFFILGILGLFLPILQGMLFLLISLYLMSLVSPRVRLLKRRLRKRYPKMAKMQDQAEDWVERKLFRRGRTR